MRNNYLEALYYKIYMYATTADYDVTFEELEELAYKGGYTKQQLYDLIKDIYDALPFAWPLPKEEEN